MEHFHSWSQGKHCTFAITGVLADNTTGLANVNRFFKKRLLF
jgi:hypothetical protein